MGLFKRREAAPVTTDNGVAHTNGHRGRTEKRGTLDMDSGNYNRVSLSLGSVSVK